VGEPHRRSYSIERSEGIRPEGRLTPVPFNVADMQLFTDGVMAVILIIIRGGLLWYKI
jgi:hypothetical protein